MARELMTKTRNAIRKVIPEIEDTLKNVNINGRKDGCTGYVTNPQNGKTIYLCTDVIPASYGCYYFRSAPAANTSATLHGSNTWFKTFDDFISGICRELS